MELSVLNKSGMEPIDAVCLPLGRSGLEVHVTVLGGQGNYTHILGRQLRQLVMFENVAFGGVYVPCMYLHAR